MPTTVTLVVPPEKAIVTGDIRWKSPAWSRIGGDLKVVMPGAVTVMLYVAGGNAANANWPFEPDT
ncbi:MAG TPA: hypothetical protein VHD85_05850 [Terracidiphilus sp.]|nr:hypothetical protein [Terracidiphilus sp.]